MIDFSEYNIEEMKKIPTHYYIDGKEVDIETLHTLAKISGYEEKVPSIEQFIYDPYYLGKSLGDGLYPIWVKAAKTLFPTPYHSPVGEVVLSGAIGLGKSTFALLVTMYDICRMLSLKNPQQHYKLVESTIIKYALMNATKHLAQGVLWSQFEDWVNASPYFKSKVFITSSGRRGKTYFIKNVDVGTGSRGSDFLGTATAGAIFSEINDMTVVAGQAEDNLDTIAIRRESRFAPSNQEILGHLILDSSNKGNRSFIDARIEDKQKRGIKDYIIFAFSQWEAKWHMGRYSGEFFQVYAGDEYIDPFIVDDTNRERLATLKQNRIIDVPVEHYESFKFNLIKAIRDLAGVSTYSSTSFISSQEILNKAMCQPLFPKKEMIQLDFFDKSQKLIDFIDVDILKHISQAPRYIHVDLGIVSDSTGISCTYFDGFMEVTRKDPFKGEVVTSRAPKFVTEWSMEIRSTPGQEVPIYKIQNFIMDLRSKGYPIKMVSTDGYQSTNLRQNLTLEGVETKLISVDRTKDPYNELRNIILEERIRLPNLPKLKKEIQELEDVGPKFDHPVDGCFSGDTEILLIEKDTLLHKYVKFEDLTPLDTIYNYVLGFDGEKFKFCEFSSPRITKYVTEIVEIELENGETFKCTPDHLILTENGYKPALELAEEDSIISSESLYISIRSKQTIHLETAIPVYDITVPETSNFTIRGDIVVHNSKDILDSVCGSVWSCSQELAGENQARQMKDMSIALHNYLGVSSMNASGFEKKLQNFLSR